MAEFYTIDFETYYDKDYSLAKLSTEQYIRDGRFEVIGVGVKRGADPTNWFSGDTAVRAALAPLQGHYVLAHNTLFDGAILAWRYGITPRLLLDTLSMARPLHGNNIGVSLKALATHYGLGAKGDEVVRALGKRRSDFSVDELACYGDYCTNDVELTYQLFNKLKPHFSAAELRLIDGTLRMFTDPVLVLDEELLRDHLDNVREQKQLLLTNAFQTIASNNPELFSRVAAARMDGTELKDMLMSNNIMSEVLRTCGVEPPKKISNTTGRETYAFAKSDAAFTALLEHEDPTVQAVVAARLGVKSTLEETRTERFIEQAQRGAFPVPIAYSGAITTQRWAGTDKINLQNLPRGGKLRKAIKAPPGFVVVASDSSNIELRVNHTLAGQEDTIAALRDGRDLYCEFASALYGAPVLKPRDDMAPDEYAWHSDARFLGKLSHLSLGYGCGWEKFLEICRLKKVLISEDRARDIVGLWREMYYRIPALWRSANSALDDIYYGRERAVDPGGLVTTMQTGLKTPPSNAIYYPGLKRTSDGWAYVSRKGRAVSDVKLYGGKVVENICQHLARNIIAHQWLAIDTALRELELVNISCKIVLQVHDELVVVAPEEHANRVKETMVAAMATAPKWWPGIPLAAEAGTGYSYGDAK